MTSDGFRRNADELWRMGKVPAGMSDEDARFFKRNRTEIVAVRQSAQGDALPFRHYSVETVRSGDGRWRLVLTDIGEGPAALPAGHDALSGSQLTIPFEDGRVLATALLRAVYAYSPPGAGADDTPPEHALSLILELLASVSPDIVTPSPVWSVRQLVARYERALLDIGKAKRETEAWKARHANAADWARRNHRRLTRVRAHLRQVLQKYSHSAILSGTARDETDGQAQGTRQKHPRHH